MRRIAAQQAIVPEFEKLQAQLRAREADNYTDARLIHDPDWAYVLYFKRSPELDARQIYVQSEVQGRAGALFALRARSADQAVDRPFHRRRKIARRRGHRRDPRRRRDDARRDRGGISRAGGAKALGAGVDDAIKLTFADELSGPQVDLRVRRFVRAFASEPHATVFQLEALGTGRVIMRDGCLRLVAFDGRESLAYFHRETGIGLDDAGYLALIDRRTGKPSGRVGEMFAWGAPNAVPKDDPAVAMLKARCGDLPVSNIGNPESKAVFDARYGRR